MTAPVLTTTTLLLGTAWTGTAPGTATTPAGTINAGSGTYLDTTGYLRSAKFTPATALKDGTTYGSGGYETNYAGLKSGTLDIEWIADWASAAIADKLNTMGIGSTIYFDLKPTSSSRGSTNPSYVGAVILSAIPFFDASVGEMGKIASSYKTTGAYATLTS